MPQIYDGFAKIKFAITFVSTLLILLMFLEGCSTSNNISNCNCLEKSDSNQYFVSGLIDHTDLEKEWLKEEIHKENIISWIKNYVDSTTSNIYGMDSLSVKNTRANKLKFYLENWRKVENKIIDRDRIYYYSTPNIYWKSLAGQDGLTVIRNCKIVYVLIITQS